MPKTSALRRRYRRRAVLGGFARKLTAAAPSNLRSCTSRITWPAARLPASPRVSGCDNSRKARRSRRRALQAPRRSLRQQLAPGPKVAGRSRGRRWPSHPRRLPRRTARPQARAPRPKRLPGRAAPQPGGCSCCVQPPELHAGGGGTALGLGKPPPPRSVARRPRSVARRPRSVARRPRSVRPPPAWARQHRDARPAPQPAPLLAPLLLVVLEPSPQPRHLGALPCPLPWQSGTGLGPGGRPPPAQAHERRLGHAGRTWLGRAARAARTWQLWRSLLAHGAARLPGEPELLGYRFAPQPWRARPLSRPLASSGVPHEQALPTAPHFLTCQRA